MDSRRNRKVVSDFLGPNQTIRIKDVHIERILKLSNFEWPLRRVKREVKELLWKNRKEELYIFSEGRNYENLKDDKVGIRRFY